MKIYTKQGDKGETALYGGRRLMKSHQIFTVLGNIDELNSYLGIIISVLKAQEAIYFDSLVRIQNDLFTIGAELATPGDAPSALQQKKLGQETIKQLEYEIDTWTTDLPELRNFILPGGSLISAHLFLARAICRRTERSLIQLPEEFLGNAEILKYFNRLSDWLFTLARYQNWSQKTPEQLWRK